MTNGLLREGEKEREKGTNGSWVREREEVQRDSENGVLEEKIIMEVWKLLWLCAFQKLIVAISCFKTKFLEHFFSLLKHSKDPF